MQTDIAAGQRLFREGEALVITGFTAVYPELRLFVGTVSDHVLTISGDAISLRSLCGRNANVVFRAE